MEINEELKNKPIKSKVYKVKPGDNLSKIAHKHSTTINQLQKINNLKDDKIQIDQILKLPN